MKTTYFFHSLRGFSNEANVYAVDTAQAEMWLAAFEHFLGSKADYAATGVTKVSRKDAERLIRRDGVGLMINSCDYNFEDCTEKKLTPASVRSARQNAFAILDDWRKDEDFAAQMEDLYPEFATR